MWLEPLANAAGSSTLDSSDAVCAVIGTADMIQQDSQPGRHDGSPEHASLEDPHAEKTGSTGKDVGQCGSGQRHSRVEWNQRVVAAVELPSIVNTVVNISMKSKVKMHPWWLTALREETMDGSGLVSKDDDSCVKTCQYQ